MFRNGSRPKHKFINKHVPAPPVQVSWNLHDKQAYPPRQQTGGRWEDFAQTLLSISPKSTYPLPLGIGVQLMQGVCWFSLRQKLNKRRCSLHGSFVAESVKSIIVTMQNNSEVPMLIPAGDSLCYIVHQPV